MLDGSGDMKESIHKYFQMGTILWMSYPNRPVLEAVKAIAVSSAKNGMMIFVFMS